TVAALRNAASLSTSTAAPNDIVAAFGTFPGCASAQVTVDGVSSTVFYSSPNQIRRPESLVPYANSPRTHSDSQVDQIAVSIEQFSFTNPILINTASGWGEGKTTGLEFIDREL